MSYRNAVNYLSSKTKVIELCNKFGGRVAVCPEWNGRVMTSSCGGLDGSSFGFINVHDIEAEEYSNKEDGNSEKSNESGSLVKFYGGEDQWTLSPEGSPFSLYYSSDSSASSLREDDSSIIVPSGFREGSFIVDSVPPDPEIRMRRSVCMTNLAGVKFDLNIVRTVKLLEAGDILALFGQTAADSLDDSDVSYVGFTTSNALLNNGYRHSKISGLVSIRIRSMFNSGQDTVAVLPFREGDRDELGPNIYTDYFGFAPHGHLRILGNSALLRADGKFRCQIGVSRKRVFPFTGSIDFREGILTLQTFNMPAQPCRCNYLSNVCSETAGNAVADFVSAREHYIKNCSSEQKTEQIPEQETGCGADSSDAPPYSGEVIRAYNHGISSPDEQTVASFYEFDFFSPAKELDRGESIMHQQHTLHINADNSTLAVLAERILGVNYTGAFEQMLI